MTGSHISLFAGVGMTDIAAEAAGFKTIATAEINPFCRRVLKVRFQAAHFEDVRDVQAWKDVMDGRDRPLLVSGGFPCQDVSDAGYKAGLDGERSGLWGEMLRVIREFEPEFVLSENVASLRWRGLHRVLNDLHHAGYDVQWDCIPAAHVGAPHLRDRIWIGAKRRAGVGRNTGTKPIGAVRRPGNGLVHTGVPLTKLPRAGAMVGGLVFERKSIANLAALKRLPLLPTPTKSDGTGGPGTTPKRAGGKNLRTVINERNGNGRINPLFLEWMMGLPLGWTDPAISSADLSDPLGWTISSADLSDPLGWRNALSLTVPETAPLRSVPNRLDRVQALGNGLVPQVASIALDNLLKW